MLEEVVKENGAVDYRKLKSDLSSLDLYLELLKNSPPDPTWSREDAFCFWINAYNAFTLKLVIDHYPVNSIKEIKKGLQIPFINSVFDMVFIKIGEQDLSLNDIEHRILRRRFKDYRLHFAINCASFSCPQLRNEAYESVKLESQLNEQEKVFLLDPKKNLINGKNVKISKIFSWFSEDFGDNAGVRKLILKHYPEMVSQDFEISYMSYNWDLNDSL